MKQKESTERKSPLTTLQEKMREEFNKWRNDGEHCSLDDLCLNQFDVAMLEEFLSQAISTAYSHGVEDTVNKIRDMIIDEDITISDLDVWKRIKKLLIHTK